MRKLANMLLIGLAACAANVAWAQSTIFTYQGRLSANGTPANGFYDFRFTIYKIEVGGQILAGPQTNAAVAVTGGLFTIPLDFGKQPFLGVNRFLDIGVRPTGSANDFTSIGPRVRIASAPYAIAAANVIDGAVTAESLSPGPGSEGQILRMSNGVLAWGSGTGTGGSVSSVGTGPGLLGGPITTTGTISLDSTIVPLLNGNQTFTGSNRFSGVVTSINSSNKFAGVFFGNGAGLSNIVASATNSTVTMAGDVIGPSSSATVARIRSINVSGLVPAANQVLRYNGTDWAPSLVALGTDVTGTLQDARLSANVPLLNGNQTFTGSNTFSGVSSLANANNRFAGAFFGNGAGLSNIVATATNGTITLAGDVTGPSTSATVAGIRNISVSAVAPTPNQHLRYNGSSWTPGAVALGSDVSGTLAVANGGTGAATPAGARASLGAASSGANSDITSLSSLITPLSPAQGGSGLNTYSAGDILYASAPNILSRRPIGTSGQVLSVSGGMPVWSPINNHDHFGQIWSGTASDGLFLSNTSTVPGASALTGASWATNDIAYGLFGQTASSEGIGVEGFAFATSGLSTGVFGESTSTNGTGVYGFGSASSGQPIGVYGESGGPQGIGVYGIGAATNGNPVGVYGTVSTPGGYGFYTPNRLYVGQSATIVGNVAAGAFFGNGAGLSNIVATATNSVVTMGGDVTGASTGSTVARIRNVNVLATAPTAGTFLRFSGTDWAPASVALATDVTGTLADARLSTNVALRNASQTFSGNLTFASGARLLAASGTAASPGIAFSTSLAAGIFNPAANVLSLGTAGTERLRIAADGKTGIGRIPLANTLEVEGTASKTASGNWSANSDARIKKDVRTLDHALDKIDLVRPVSFHYTDEYRAAHPCIEDKTYLNVIAQEFAKVFPDAVKESGEILDGKPILQVDIHPAAVYAIAAIQELHQLVKAKDDQVAKLKEQNASLEQRLQALEKAVERVGR